MKFLYYKQEQAPAASLAEVWSKCELLGKKAVLIEYYYVYFS